MIEVRDLQVRLEEKLVLDGVNLAVQKGESLVIAGPSGCGKSVFLKTVLGLMPAESGAIFIKGRNVLEMNQAQLLKLRERIGMVFQNSALFDSLTIWENVGFFSLYHSRLAEKEIKTQACQALAGVGLAGVEDLRPEQLSGGMKKRASIARALFSRPEILFYDEPTTGLDPITSENITRLTMDIHRRLGTTDITVTHDVKLAGRIADRIALLENGKVEEVGTFEELRKVSRSPLIKSYLEAFETGN
jgi:phospholipid/cholesterol/gamma-HCH transport system ATP-binding protein